MVSLFKVGSPIPLIILETTPYEGASHLALGVPRLRDKRRYVVPLLEVGSCVFSAAALFVPPREAKGRNSFLSELFEGV